ncbi:unnamed protein product [Lactuca virosa]|uniref:Uncharacterized protein n=1 Tax=Lactuca virosa TaxID=75947 RepID=A0AAU9PU29_9ASTR|nr:unnamed protein product [Lactuca virosa]
MASSLPPFLHPFTSNMFSQLLSLGNMIDEEGMDMARTDILEGLHWMNEVSLWNKDRNVAFTMQWIEFERAFKLLEDLRANYQALEREKQGLSWRRMILLLKNGRLLRELDHYSQHHEELLRMIAELKNVTSKKSAHHVALATK